MGMPRKFYKRVNKDEGENVMTKQLIVGWLVVYEDDAYGDKKFNLGYVHVG